jgi:hypothetical protein
VSVIVAVIVRPPALIDYGAAIHVDADGPALFVRVSCISDQTFVKSQETKIAKPARHGMRGGDTP